MSNPIDTMGRCVVCGKKCESSAGCDCTTINAYGAGSPTAMLAPDALAIIAARDAEIRQQAEDLERLRETIDKLTKSRREVATRAESLESKCAKMRGLLGELRNRIDAILESEEA